MAPDPDNRHRCHGCGARWPVTTTCAGQWGVFHAKRGRQPWLCPACLDGAMDCADCGQAVRYDSDLDSWRHVYPAPPTCWMVHGNGATMDAPPLKCSPTPEEVAAWWKGDRDSCPRCGSDDVGTWGLTSERTDANVAELAECEECTWHAERDREEAEAEALEGTPEHLKPLVRSMIARGVEG